MRPIKFRSWNEDVRMFDVIDFNDPVATAVCVKTGTLQEQFTGLLDKNGKEIYEGDILAGDFGNAGDFAKKRKTKRLRYQILWGNHGDQASFYPSVVAADEEEQLEEVGGDWFRFFPNASQSEIIGNIHENPELLQ